MLPSSIDSKGLGVYNALDDRNPQAVQAKTGGLTQALTYIAGGSGGAVGTTVLSYNGDRSVLDRLPIILGPSDAEQQNAYGEIQLKNETGLPTRFVVSRASLLTASVADVFGVSTGYGVAGRSAKPDPLSVLFSGIADSPAVQDGTGPAPVIMVAEIEPGVSPSYDSVSAEPPPR